MTQLQLAYMIAKSEKGIHESLTGFSEPRILEYATATSLHAESDKVAWCSAFANWCIMVAGFVMDADQMLLLCQKTKLAGHDITTFASRALAHRQAINEQAPVALQNIPDDVHPILPTLDASARSFLNWGVPTTSPIEGDLVIFKRGSSPWQGHVGFVAGAPSLLTLPVLGGNQANSVCTENFLKLNILGYRTLK